MNKISNGYTGREGFKQYQEYKTKYGLEDIRKSIVLASYGFLIVRHATDDLYNKIKYDFSEQEHYIKYLDENITIEEVDSFDTNDDNCQTCYIDFYMSKVYLL